jgi:DNA replication protein DnaC
LEVAFLGPPGTGKTHLAIGIGIRACQAGHRVAFATASEWVSRLAEAHAHGPLQEELTRLGRIPLLIVDEVGYIPFEAETANLFFQLVSSRYERASVIVTSNTPDSSLCAPNVVANSRDGPPNCRSVLRFSVVLYRSVSSPE